MPKKNYLKNGEFYDGMEGTFKHWRGNLMPPWSRSCAYLKKVGTEKTGFYQDIGGSAFKSGGKFILQMLVLTTTSNAWVKPTVWLFYEDQEPQPTQAHYRLRKGEWNIVWVELDIRIPGLKKVRAEIYYGPNDAIFVIRAARFGR